MVIAWGKLMRERYKVEQEGKGGEKMIPYMYKLVPWEKINRYNKNEI